MKKAGAEQIQQATYVCDQCNGVVAFTTPLKLVAHTFTAHPTNGFYDCPHCDDSMIYYSQSDLDVHIRTAHPGGSDYLKSQYEKMRTPTAQIEMTCLCHRDLFIFEGTVSHEWRNESRRLTVDIVTLDLIPIPNHTTTPFKSKVRVRTENFTFAYPCLRLFQIDSDWEPNYVSRFKSHPDKDGVHFAIKRNEDGSVVTLP